MPFLPETLQETSLPQPYHYNDQSAADSRINQENEGLLQSQPGPQSPSAFDITGSHAPQKIRNQEQDKS